MTVYNGFRVYNGRHNVIIGNNVSLNDVLINAGDTKDGEVIIKDNVFFGHRCMLLERTHTYISKGLSRQFAITANQIIIEDGA